MRNRTKYIAILALALAGCASQPVYEPVAEQPLRLPYQFHLAKFVDVREDDNFQQMAQKAAGQKPFPFEEFATSMVTAMNQDLFVSDPAALEIELIDAAMVKEKVYLVSVYANLKAYNSLGTHLGEARLSCVTDSKEPFALGSALKKVWSEDGRRKQQDMWSKLVYACARDMAAQFSNVILKEYRLQQNGEEGANK